MAITISITICQGRQSSNHDMIRFWFCVLKCCLIKERTIQTPTRRRGLCCKEQTKPLLTDVRDKSMLHCRTLNLQHMVCKVCYQGILGLRLLWALRNRHSGERLHPSTTRARLQFTAPDSRPDETWIKLRSAQKGSHSKKKFLFAGQGGDAFCYTTTRYQKQMMGTTRCLEEKNNSIFCVFLCLAT